MGTAWYIFLALGVAPLFWKKINSFALTSGIQKLPFDYNKMTPWERHKYLSKDYNNVTGAEALRTNKINVDEVIEFLKSVTKDNCHRFHPDDLILRGDISYGVEAQFENEARMALRLANFLSAFLQVCGCNLPFLAKLPSKLFKYAISALLV